MSDITATSRTGPRFAYAGCFTTKKRRARGLGIDCYQINDAPSPAEWTFASRSAGLDNPSFLLSDPDRQVLYTIHGDGDHASAYRADADTGALRLLGHAETGGTNAVHLALDPSKRFLLTANYGTGSVAVLPVRPDGALGDAIEVRELPGVTGPHKTEQTCAHPHHIVFDPSGAFVVVPDKGLDAVFVLVLGSSGRLEVVHKTSMRPGAGPRHIVFHPSQPLAFLVNEIDSTIATLRWDQAAGTLTPHHVVSTLPPDFFGASTAAALVITPCGRFIYASNRGQDGIACFAYNEAAVGLAPNGWTPAEGRDPRFMCLDASGRHLLVANEQGDSIAGFAIDQKTGNLAHQGTRASLSPCTIAFL